MNSEKTEIALRAYIKPNIKHSNTYNSNYYEEYSPNIVGVIDTETTIDQYQNLLFGSFGIWIEDKLSRFIVFYSDNLSKKEVRILQNRVTRHYVEDIKTELLPISKFIDEVFYPYVYDSHARLVGFNLPFDLSRVAIKYGFGRSKWKDGFTFTLTKKRFRAPIHIKSLDSTKAFIAFAKPPRHNQKHSRKHFKGRFLDLKTLGFALTNEKLTLENGCKLFQTKYQKTKTEEHGKITLEYIEYNINDVLATYNLHQKMIEQFDSFNLHIKPEKTYSPASIGKQYLRQMHIRSFLEQNPDFPPETLGYIMTTYYGGRSEVRIRKKSKKVRYMDFTSMYPAQFSLLNLWSFLIADKIEPKGATKEIRNLVEEIDLESLRNPELWKNIVAIVQIQPENDILPARSHYGDNYVYNIGINYLTSSTSLWYALPDVIASKLLTGKSPKILKAIKFVPKGKQGGLSPITIVGGRKVNPEENLFSKIIEIRKEIQNKQKQIKNNPSDYRKLDAIQQQLKIVANAASYGIFIEVNTETKNTTVDVYGLKHFKTKTSKKEEFGGFFNPIISIMLTSGARLLLAMAEAWLEDHRGYYTFCDTDSIAVSPFHWKSLQKYFEPLNPFKEGKFLKLEKENYDEKGQLRDLWFYGISAKRYVLYILDEKGKTEPVKWSSHGLGRLQIENEIEWEKQLWTNILLHHYGKISKQEFLVDVNIC